MHRLHKKRLEWVTFCITLSRNWMQIFVSAYIIPQRCPNFHDQDKHKLIQKKSSWSNYVRHLTNLCQLVGPKFPKTSDKSHASTIFETFFFIFWTCTCGSKCTLNNNFERIFWTDVICQERALDKHLLAQSFWTYFVR